MGDTIYLKQGAMVLDVEYNELKGLGTVLGEEFTPVESLPVVLPKYPTFTTDPGASDVEVARDETVTLLFQFSALCNGMK